MVALQEFLRRSESAHTAKDIFDLPEAEPLAAVKIDYDRLALKGGSILSGSFSKLFDKKYAVRDRAFEAASPLTIRIMTEEVAAGVDIEKRNYELTVRKMMAAEAFPYSWHTDYVLPEKFGDMCGVVPTSLRRNYIMSDIFCTATTSLSSIGHLKPAELDWDDFGRIICDASQDISEGAMRKWRGPIAAKGATDVDRVLTQIRTALECLRATRKVAAPNEAKCVTGAMPHAFAYRIEPEPVQGIERYPRNLVLFESKPN